MSDNRPAHQHHRRQSHSRRSGSRRAPHRQPSSPYPSSSAHRSARSPSVSAVDSGYDSAAEARSPAASRALVLRNGYPVQKPPAAHNRDSGADEESWDEYTVYAAGAGSGGGRPQDKENDRYRGGDRRRDRHRDEGFLLGTAFFALSLVFCLGHRRH